MEAKRVIDDLKALGIQEEDTIIVHSSYQALQGSLEIEGGPQAIIDALKAVVINGTLMLPTLSYVEVTVDNRVFNIKSTASCVGILPETMRRNKDVYRSIHPTHSICIWGKDAKKIAEAHQNDVSPVGPFSPLQELKRRSGKIVMLGCSLKCNTSMHGVEEMCIPPYLYQSSFDYQVTLANGKTMTMDVLRHDFKGVEQRYDRIVNVLSKKDYQVGMVLHAKCYVLEARAVWKKALDILKTNPYYFVDIKEENI